MSSPNTGKRRSENIVKAGPGVKQKSYRIHLLVRRADGSIEEGVSRGN